VGRKAVIIIAVVLIIDQISKIWVKTNMHLNESITVFDDWFFIHFIENPGMAFGLEFGGETGKILLSLFRIVAIVFIGIYLRNLVRKEAHSGLIISVALVFAGAAGNIIDSTIYGLIFSESPPMPVLATLFPEGGGYAGILQGKVVDMLYFPIIDTTWPEWVPGLAGDRLQFFRPIFNIADSSITIGMALILINQKRFFNEEKDSPNEVEAEKNPE
jgi:signal peptidase II